MPGKPYYDNIVDLFLQGCGRVYCCIQAIQIPMDHLCFHWKNLYIATKGAKWKCPVRVAYLSTPVFWKHISNFLWTISGPGEAKCKYVSNEILPS